MADLGPAELETETIRQLREHFPKNWAIVSTPDGGAVQPRALASFLRSLGLVEVATGPQAAALDCLLTYVRGDQGGLEVRPSLLEGAGLGLFATRPFAPGELLCVYSGTVVPMARVLRGEVATDYLMGGFQGCSIDAADHPEVLARYINDHVEPGQLNARFAKVRRERRALVLATRPIAPDEEIYAAYGQGYWRARGCAGQAPAPASPAVPHTPLPPCDSSGADLQSASQGSPRDGSGVGLEVRGKS